MRYLAIAVVVIVAVIFSPRKAWASASRNCLSYEAHRLLDTIERRFGPVQVISTCRPGAKVRGTGRPSRHASGNAIDFRAGARKQAIVEWLAATHRSGGLMTYRHSSHIHVDIGPHFIALGSGGACKGVKTRRAAYAGSRKPATSRKVQAATAGSPR